MLPRWLSESRGGLRCAAVAALGALTVAVFCVATCIATVVGVPAGTWLGQQAGWRAAFAGLSGIGLIALVTTVTFLPSTAGT